MFLRDKKLARAVATVIALMVAAALVLSMVQVASAHTALDAAGPTSVRALPAEPTPTPTPSESVGRGNPPKTKTPQGQATQVTDDEHIGGLIGYIVFMAGGLALLYRGHRRTRRQSTPLERAQAATR